MHKSILLLAAAATAQGGLSEFAGSWSCVGKTQASPLQPAHPTRATLQFQAGPWTRVRFAEEKTRENAFPQSAFERWGREGDHFVRYLFDNFGGTGKASSGGFLEGALVWTGDYDLRGVKLAFRETFTRKGTALAQTLELNQSGEWKVMSSATCTRSKK